MSIMSVKAAAAAALHELKTIVQIHTSHKPVENIRVGTGSQHQRAARVWEAVAPFHRITIGSRGVILSDTLEIRIQNLT